MNNSSQQSSIFLGTRPQQHMRTFASGVPSFPPTFQSLSRLFLLARGHDRQCCKWVHADPCHRAHFCAFAGTNTFHSINHTETFSQCRCRKTATTLHDNRYNFCTETFFKVQSGFWTPKPSPLHMSLIVQDRTLMYASYLSTLLSLDG